MRLKDMAGPAMLTITLSDLYTNPSGFQAVNDLVYQALAQPNEKLQLRINGWVDANMCAPLGAALTYLQSRDIHGTIKIEKDGTRGTLAKNNFLSQFGVAPQESNPETIIEYQRFGVDAQSAESFKRYIDESFRSGVRGMPQMTAPLLKEFRKSLYELYNNALEHAESALGVITCGQYFPKKGQLHFSIADLGIGIRQRIQQSKGMLYHSDAAIEWAVSGNTTRTGPRPGGLGLQLLREFIKLNVGRLVIVSDAGYWRQRGGEARKQTFTHSFPGTVVTMVINTADPAAYCLRSEIDATQIF